MGCSRCLVGLLRVVSGKPELCGVCRIWLLFVFLVCGVVVLSMIVCLASDAVVFGTVVWHRCCVICRGARYCEYCCEQPCVCFKRLRLLRNLCYSVLILIECVDYFACVVLYIEAVDPLLCSICEACRLCDILSQPCLSAWLYCLIVIEVLCYFRADGS